MKALMIGSLAASLRGIDLGRECRDVDVFCDGAGKGVDDYWHPSFSSWIPEGLTVATLDELYTIKVSHSYWALRNGSWNKHMADQVTLKQAGAHIDQELHDNLYKVWVELHGAKATNLNMDASDFFSDAVTRIYVHDSIHDSVAYGERPMYEYLLKDGQTVAMDMNKVWLMSFEDQVKLFREEVYATALERWVIPSGYKYSPRKAYAQAVRKTITSLTKGRSAQFMSENYDIFRTPDMDYVRRHRENKHKLVKLEK